MTATLEAEASAVSAPVPQRARGVRPGALVVAAVLLAVATLLWAAAGAPLIVGMALFLACAVTVAGAAVVGVRRASFVAAPLAIVMLMVANPIVLGVAGVHLEDRIGRITLSSEGVVLWQQYPGIAGWTAPAAPTHADTADLVSTAQAHGNVAVDTLSVEAGWMWAAAEPAAVTPIPNGFGGVSLFDRIDGPVWSATGFGGADAERALLLDVAAGLAEKLRLPVVEDPTGDVETGDGTRAWTGNSGCVLTVSIDGETIRVSFTGGPYLRAGVSAEEYAAALIPFGGLTFPEPLFLPALP